MPSPIVLARGIRAAGAASPRIAGALAYRAFFSTGARMPVHERDTATHEAAKTGRLAVRGAELTTYEWGTGSDSVLLLHGWRGRASQFAPLVRELVAEGLRVVAFDAPAHGSSGGRDTDVRDWIAAAGALQAEHPPFTALVGHSFGALAALTAARTTVPVPAVVTIAGAASPAAFVEEFVRELALRPGTASAMRSLFLARLGVDDAGLEAQYDAARHPLPDSTRLLVVHDGADRRMPDADSVRLHEAHGQRSRLLRTQGFGHTRILSADAVLDAVVAHVQEARVRTPAERAISPR